MLRDADTVGVFQIESRAQMAMLPRLKPRTFYDLVVEVAIIRPGPIIGQMVHPYLRRRDGREKVTYPHPCFEPILGRTLGVTLFQEQVMRLATAAAGFTLGEADELRRAMGHKRSREKFLQLKERFIAGLGRLGLSVEQGEAVFKQFEGFAHYGFPESHSASFALIAYASAWLKRHHPAAFAVGLLNAQPMGFYAPHTLLEDARRHGVPARPVDVQQSLYDCSLEPLDPAAPRERHPHAPACQPFAIRLGLRMVRGLREKSARRLIAARESGPFGSLYDLWRRTHLSHADLARLATADALAPLLPPGSTRREALWSVHALPVDEGDLFARASPPPEPPPSLPPLGPGERLVADFQATGASLAAHPMELLRGRLERARVVDSRRIATLRHGSAVRTAGMAIVRQRPETAKGMFFMTLEDEHGFVNVVATPDTFAEYRRVARTALFVLVKGKVERSGKVVHVKVQSFEELTLGEELPVHSRDFH
jgi:error-prone DNA polymerase